MDPVQAQQLEEARQQAEQEAWMRDLVVVFDEPTGAGERVLARLTREFWGQGTTAVVTAPGALDPYGTFMHEGERRVVCWLADELRQAREWRLGTPPPPATGITETEERNA